MAIGKSINKKSFYGGSEMGGTPDIAMPPLDETPAIAQSAPDPWQNPTTEQKQDNPFGQVPNDLPQDTRDAMSQYEQSDNEKASTPDVVEPPQEQSTKSREDHPNFRAIRDAKERAERERDAMLTQMLEMQQRMQTMHQQQKQEDQPVEDYDFEIDSDALVEGKHVKKVTAKLKAMEQQLKRYQAQSEETAVEAKIRAQYPDFEKVVSKENVEMLNSQFPEIAKTLRDTPDIYNKAAAAYTVIKNFGIHKEQVPYDSDKAKAVANSQKPRPLASVNPTQGDSPLSKANAFANGMTDELKEQLRKEMYAARKAM